MAHAYRIALVLAVLVGAATRLHSLPAESLVTVRGEVEKLVTPILDARVELSHCSSREQSFDQADRLLGHLLGVQTPAADEALVVLMSFYVGESAGEDVIHEVTKRGSKMLPLLRRYKNRVPEFQNRHYPSCLALDRATATEAFEKAISAIVEGQVVGDE